MKVDLGLRYSFAAALFAAGIVYCTLPAIGLIIFGEYGKGALALLGAAACAMGVAAMVRRTGWGSLVG